MVTPMNFADIMALEAEGEDRWLGRGPRYPWGGLFGGQILSQSLRAALAKAFANSRKPLAILAAN